MIKIFKQGRSSKMYRSRGCKKKRRDNTVGSHNSEAQPGMNTAILHRKRNSTLFLVRNIVFILSIVFLSLMYGLKDIQKSISSPRILTFLTISRILFIQLRML